MNVGPPEILVILILALLVFGPKRLPEVGRQVGAAVRELRRMQDTVRGELDMVLHPEHGTWTAGASNEPADHTAIGPVDTASPEDVSPEIMSPEVVPPEVTLDATEPNAAEPNAAETDRGFLGPPDSFI